MPDGTTAMNATLGVTPEGVSGVRPRALELCLAQADNTLIARPQESRRSTASTR
jgi:hypothetical protein